MRANERMKKVFSILLCLCMVLQYVPTTAFAATEVPALDSQGFVTYTDGVIQYVKYDNYLYKVTYTNLQNIDALYLYEEYGYLRINISESMMELHPADSYTGLEASELPKTVGGTLNCYNYGDRVIDENAPVVIITCVAVNEPTWSWASDHSSAAAVFTAKEGDIFVTLSADASFVATACSEGDQITYTASVTFNGNTYTDQQEVIKPHDWIRQEGPTCVQICSRCGTTQTDAHIYDNACDTDCNNCGATRETAHAYDNACDTDCNNCGATRETEHAYDNACDTDCNNCGATRETEHVYDNACDTDCNNCGATRETEHVYDNACDTDCNNCGATREAGHHYDSDCDSECNSCGVSRETTIAHTYDYVCDQDCNACGEVRDAFHNVEDGACTYCGMRYYGVLVAGVQITGENASDVLGDGTISFDVATNTLTLNGATVNMTETNLAIHESTQQEHKDRIKNGESFEPYFNPLTPALQITDGEVTLVLQGENTLIGLDYWILGSDIFESLRYGVPAVTIADGASLTVTGDDTATLTLLSADIGYTDPDHIPCGSSISGDSLTVAGGTVTTVNGIRLTGDYIQTGGSVEAGFLEAQNVTVSDGILNAQGYSGIQPHYADPNAGGIHGIFARKNITVTGGTVTAFSGIVGHNGDYHSTSMIDGETITTHGLYALESISITGGTVTSTGCVGGYVIDEMGALTRGEYSGRGPAPGAALEAPQWSISDTATFICGSDTSHRGGTGSCEDEQCAFCGVPFEETTHSYDQTTHICSVCGKVETFTVYWGGVYQLGLTESTSTFGQDFTQTFTVPENTHLEIKGVHLWEDASVPVNYTYENGVLTIAAADVPAADIEIDCYHYVNVTFDGNGGKLIPEEGYSQEGDTGFATDGSYWVQECPVGGEITLYGCLEVRRAGYTFVDWRDASGKVYPMTQVNGEKQVSATEDVTLYAQWQCLHTGEKNRTYENMGTYHNYVETCAICGENTDRGVMFEHDYDETTHACVCGAIETFTITFDPANGEEKITITQDYGTSITAPAIPTKDGYHFVKWDTEVPTTMPALDEELTITAVWEAHSGGEATCETKAVCEICGTSYGNTVDHSMSYTAEGMTITYKCATCDTQTVTYTLVIPTGMVYGSSAMEVPHYTKIGEHSGDTPVITLKQGETTVNEPINAGTYAVTMTWGGQTVSGEYTIAPKELTAEDVTITLSPDSFFYDGSEKLPSVTIKLGDKTLDGGTFAAGYDDTNTTCDYQVIIPGDRITPQRKALTIFFRNNYSGETVVYYTITVPEAILSPAEPNGKNGWYKDASLLAPSDYAISTTKDGTFGASLPLSDGTYENINYWLTYPDNENCEPASQTWTGNIKVDGTAPTVSGTAGSVTDSTASITVTADDVLSGVASVTLTCTDPSVTIGALTDGAFPVSGMHPNRDYTFTLTAKDEASNETVTTVELTTKKGDSSVIEAPTVKSLTYTGQMQELVTPGTAVGGTLQYSVNGGEWSEEVPTASEVGDYQISYQVVGNSDYNGIGATALPVVQIKKAKLTITAEDHTITYGDVPSANGVTGSGFVTGESFDDLSGELTYTFNYEHFGDVGTYKITPAGLTSYNYEITFADGTLTVNAKAITVTADAVSKTYGDTDPTLTYTAQGLVNGDELTGELKRAAGENVGSYAIEQNTLTAGNNYRLAYTGAKLTIKAKAITAADVKLNGSLTYNGKEQTQAITVTEGITYEVTGNKATNVGTYELNVKGTGNYTGSVTLDWTITKAKLTITADSKVIYIGEKLPTLTYTVSGLVGGDKLTKEPALTTNADADQAGSYTITAANADAGMNYAITYVGGTLTIMDKNTEVETKVETAALTEVPDGLKNTKFNTVEAIKQELTSRIVATSTGFVKENMAHYDVTLQFSLDGGETWILATEENFPTEGIIVTLPYPYGTNAAGYDFVVSHMFTVTSQRLGTTAGDVELPSVTETASGIRVTLKGLSPVTLAWRATEFDVKIAGTTNGTVSTNVSKATSGTEITVTVTPKYGYKMATLTVKDASGKSYAVSTDNSGKYYFTMPSADVTVTATFSKISSSTADTTNPKTGDDFQLMLWSSILSTSAIFLLAALADQKRKLIK